MPKKKLSLAQLRDNWKGFQEETVEVKAVKPPRKGFLTISRTEEKLMRKHGINPYENSEVAKEAYVKIRKAWKKAKKIVRQKKHQASVIVKRNAPKKTGGKKKK